MEQRQFQFVLEAREPIAHHEMTVGNTSLLMRRKVRQPDGSWANVPCISADTMRHGLREAAAYAYLDAAGLLADGGALTGSALRLLFNGGMVTGSAGGSVKLSDYREMVDLMPPLSLLGGCAQNRVVPGRLWVDDAKLICDEQAHLLPEWVGEWMGAHGGALDSSRAHVEEQQRVRMDPITDPAKRNLLTAGEREQEEQRLLKSENASAMDDDKAAQQSKGTMMPRSYERLAQGSLFHWSVTATCYSDLEVDTFHVMCAAFLHDARVGGKKGTGHGLLRPVTGRNVNLRRPSERIESIEPDKLGAKVGTLFQRHVQDRADQIREFLGEVAS